MATNLKFLYPDIASKTRLAATTAASGYSADNIETGARRLWFKASADATSTRFDYDYGVGITKQPTHLVLAGAHVLRLRDTAATTVRVIGDSSSAFATTPETETTTYNIANLIGPRSEDFVLALSFATAFRYFRAETVTTATVRHEFSKFLFCESFDLGRDPTYAQQSAIDLVTGWEIDGRIGYTMKFEGITDAKKAAWMSTLDPVIDVSPIFIYDALDYQLDGMKLLHCFVTSVDWAETRVYGFNDLTITLEQTI